MNDTINPYQSPVAGTADVESLEPYEPAVFSFNGRIGRLRYFAYSSIYTVVFYIAILVVVLAFGGFAGSGSEGPGAAMIGAMVLLYIALFVGVAALIRRRLHDLGKTAWMGLLIIVPLVNFFFALYLLFAKGDEGANDYGARPIKNHGGLWVIAFAPILFVGILAAAAIPAYQDYVNRAAAQAAE